MKPEDLESIEKMAVKCIFHECFCGKDASLLCAELRKAWKQLEIAQEALIKITTLGNSKARGYCRDAALEKIEALDD